MGQEHDSFIHIKFVNEVTRQMFAGEAQEAKEKLNRAYIHINSFSKTNQYFFCAQTDQQKINHTYEPREFLLCGSPGPPAASCSSDISSFFFSLFPVFSLPPQVMSVSRPICRPRAILISPLSLLAVLRSIFLPSLFSLPAILGWIKKAEKKKKKRKWKIIIKKTH